MKIINRPRGTGKTTQLIYLSEVNRIPIVSKDPKYIIDLAKRMGCDIPEPISMTKYVNSSFSRGCAYDSKYYIDDLECIIDFILPNVEAVTTSIGKEKLDCTAPTVISEEVIIT